MKKLTIILIIILILSLLYLLFILSAFTGQVVRSLKEIGFIIFFIIKEFKKK